MNGVERETIRNWSRNVEFEARVYRPKTEEQVIGILNEVLNAPGEGGRRIRVIGSKHSMNDIARSEAVIDMSALNKISLQRDALTVTAGAGVTLEALQKELASVGLTLPARGTIKKQTIAGAISTGTHGSGNPSLSNFVTRVRIASYKSGIAEASNVDSGEDLLAARTALGAMGVILDVTLSVRHGYFIEQGFEIADDIEKVLVADLKKPGELGYPMQLFIRLPYHENGGYYVSRRRESPRPRGFGEFLKRILRRVRNCVMNDLLLPVGIKYVIARLGSTRIQAFYTSCLPKLLKNVEAVVDDDDHVQTMRHELCFLRNQDVELFVPEINLRGADRWLMHVIKAFADRAYQPPKDIVASIEGAGLAEAFARRDYTVHVPVFYQRVKGDKTLISMTAGDTPYYSIIVLSYLAPEADRGFEEFAKFVSEGFVRIFGARAHWGKHFPLSVTDLERRYDPNLARFRAVCNQYDPKGVFRNDFTARTLGLATPQRKGAE